MYKCGTIFQHPSQLTSTMASVDTAAVHLYPSLYLRDMVLTSHVSNGPGGLKTRLSSQPAFVIFLSLHYFFLSLDFSFVLFLFFFSFVLFLFLFLCLPAQTQSAQKWHRKCGAKSSQKCAKKEPRTQVAPEIPLGICIKQEHLNSPAFQPLGCWLQRVQPLVAVSGSL